MNIRASCGRHETVSDVNNVNKNCNKCEDNNVKCIPYNGSGNLNARILERSGGIVKNVGELKPLTKFRVSQEGQTPSEGKIVYDMRCELEDCSSE